MSASGLREEDAPARCYVALGSNVGDRRAHLEGAEEALRADPRVRVLAVSPWIETEPIGGPPGQGRYLNGALLLETRLAPRELLGLLARLERAAGRDRAAEGRDGPRTLDLDLLLHGNARVQSADLELPHPRMEDRLFVLEPLEAIAPTLVLPRSGLTVRERVARLRAASEESARAGERRASR